MLRIFQSLYKEGQILVSNDIKIPENTKVFISYDDDSNDDFFLIASESSLDKIWNNTQDDIYEKLLKK